MTMDDALRVSLLRLDTCASPPCRQDKTATAPTTTLKKRNHAAPELSHGQHQEDSAAILMNLLLFYTSTGTRRLLPGLVLPTLLKAFFPAR